MTFKWSNWNRFIIFSVFVIIVITGITLYSVSEVQARTTLEQSFNLNPNNLCQTLSPEDTASYVAEKLTEMTGEAISPLFSLTIIGGFKNFCTSSEYRDLLPWYYQSKFLIGSFSILSLLILKDTLLTFLGPLKQPLDAVAELIHMVSGLVALPIGIIYFADGVSNPIASELNFLSHLIMPSAMAIDLNSATDISGYFFLAQTLGITLGLLIFVSIWIFGNILEIFIVLSPIPFVDTILSAIKTTFIAVIILISYWNPLLGGVCALFVLLVSLIVFNWSFRLFTFAILYCSDFIRLRWRKFTIDQAGILAFSHKNIPAVNSGILGRLLPYDRNSLIFVYYPYLVLPKQKKIINVDSFSDEQMAVVEGVIAPNIMKATITGENTPQEISTLFRLPPRYRKLEKSIAQYLSITFDDTILAKQKKGLLSWLKNIF